VATLLFGQAQGLAPTTKQQDLGKQPCIFVNPAEFNITTKLKYTIIITLFCKLILFMVHYVIKNYE